MISQNIQTHLNKYLNINLNDSYSFLSISSFFAKNNKSSLCDFFKNLSSKELHNSMKLYDYILKRNGSIEFYNINKPYIKSNIISIIKNIDNKKTASINNLKFIIDLANYEKDYATTNFLEKLIIEEYKSENEIRKLMKHL